MNYFEKYIKYKNKYLNLLANINIDENIKTNINDLTNIELEFGDGIGEGVGGEVSGGVGEGVGEGVSGGVGGGIGEGVGGGVYEQNFICKPNKPRYNQICIQDNNGDYKSKQMCEEQCDTKFISVQLKRANLYKESLQFYFFIQDLIKHEQMNIYIKGGNVIGLAVLKLIYNAYSGDNYKFKKAFDNFLKLELIKDWDFTGYTHEKQIDSKYRTKLDKLAGKQKLVPRAKTFILYQSKYPILIYEKALFEIAIVDSDSTDFSKMEIPLTTMKIKVDESNIKYIFMLGKSFYSWTKKHIPIDLDIVKKIISQIEIIVHPHKLGLYDPKHKLDVGELNKHIVEFINLFTKNDIYWTQFLITQLEDPYRLIYRMGEKNIKKTAKIIEFINKNIPSQSRPTWLLDVGKTTNIMNGFIERLGKKLAQIYQQTHSLDKVLEFLDGVYFGKPQIQIEWEEFDKETKNRLKKVFEPVIKQIGLEKFKELVSSYKIDSSVKSSELSNSDKIIKLFNFLIGKRFFN